MNGDITSLSHVMIAFSDWLSGHKTIRAVSSSSAYFVGKTLNLMLQISHQTSWKLMNIWVVVNRAVGP